MQRNSLAAVLPVAAAALAAGILLGRVADTALWGALALAAAAAGALLSAGRLRSVCVVLAVAAFGCAYGFAAYHPTVPVEGDYVITGIVSDEIRVRDQQISTRLTSVTLNGEPAPTNAYWSFYDDEVPADLAPGQQIAMTARVYAPGGAANPGGFDFREYLLGEGIVYGVYGADELTVTDAPRFTLQGTAAAIRHALVEALLDSMGDRAGGYASAMLLGTKAFVPEDELEAFSQLGIAHVLAVSGFHVGVLAALAGLLTRPLGKRAGAAVTTVIVVCYCLLTGAHAPVIRAAVLLGFATWGRMRSRQINGLWTLCGAFIVTLLINPTQLTSAGFQLSYSAVLGIATLAPRLQRRYQPDRRWAARLWKALSVSLSAQLGVMLPQLYWYHELPLAGLALNLALIPFASALIAVYWLALLLPFLGGLAGLLTEAMLHVIGWLAKSGVDALWTGQANLFTAAGWCAVLASASVLLALKGRQRTVFCLVGLVMMALSLAPVPYRGAEYIQLSVGAADAAVLRNDDTVVVIDAGEDGRDLATYLHQRRLSVDTLIVSHLHSDHVGGVAALMDEGIPVGVCCLPFGAESADVAPDMLALIERLRAAGTEIRHIARGDSISLPDGAITVLWPERDRVRAHQDGNKYSMAARIEIMGTSILTMGDLTGTHELYAAAPAYLLKVAHHGDQASTGEAFLRMVGPQAVIVSNGRSGFDAPTRERLGGLPVYSTNEMGAVTVRFGADGFEVGVQGE